ncbi:uncharacterized protein Dana_GF26477 [Drosophila ananassae]|uniref:Protein TsetseEP domain-containing protein n=1 Tax=Drosophila ananassae TaxID=7217 RepID=A0A0P8XDY4_DROAN|nr:uncharacterized protein LOC26513886 [Drosophila ananassae]KPU73018.1 uncharacterized protein Dana_GF26477 [Drosophila ananassae]
MENKVSLFLGIISCTLLVLCGATHEEYIALEKAVNSLSNVVGTYNAEFDKKVKFEVLQEAIEAIDKAMFGYNGEAKKNLDEIRELNSEAHLTYKKCVGPVYEWCIAMNSTLKTITPYITDARASAEDRDTLWNMTVTALASGLSKTSVSLDLLNQVQAKVENLQQLLDVVSREMNNDFGPEGYYGKQKQSLQEALDGKGSAAAKAIANVITSIFKTVVAIVTSNVGQVLTLAPTFADQGLDVVMKLQEKASLNQQLKAIEVFFKTLSEKIAYAKKIALEVDAALKEDHQNLHSLATLITVANNHNQLLLLADPNLRANIIPKLNDMGHKCHEYVVWHGYGTKNYVDKRVRTKRDTTELFEMGRISRIIQSLPEKYDFDMIVSATSKIMN